MSNLLVTGASGFVGQALTEKLLEQGHRIYALSRHPPIGNRKLLPIVGDITKDNLSLYSVPKDIAAVYHLAGLPILGEDKDGSLWRTNVEGTKNVISFCAKYNIPHLLFASTAYTEGRNTYEKSKALCELMLSECDIPRVTIFKPSIIMGTEKHPYPGHFSQFVSLLIKLHRRAEFIRRKIEGAIRLPVLEPVFRISGNLEAKLNLIQIDAVTDAMTTITNKGAYMLTNPNPPTLEELVRWTGEFAMVNIKMLPDFQPTPIEAHFQKMAAAFQPYLQGDSFKSDLKECPPITREFIHDTIKRKLLD